MEWKDLRDLHLQVEDPWVVVPYARLPVSLKYSRSTRSGFASRSRSRLDRFYVPTMWRGRVISHGIIPVVVWLCARIILLLC